MNARWGILRAGTAALAAGALVAGGAALATPASAQTAAPTVYAMATARALTTGLIDLANVQATAAATSTVLAATATSGGPASNLLAGLTSFGPSAAGLPLSLQLGVLAQYARADADGTSLAFAGTASQAPGLVGAQLGGASGDQAALLVLGGASTLRLTLRADVLAASARETDAGAPSGATRIDGLQLGVETPLLSPDDPLIAVLDGVLATVFLLDPQDRPRLPGSLTIDVGALLAAAGLDLDRLPPNTDLLGLLGTVAVKNALVTAVTGQLLPAAVGGIPLVGQALANVVDGLVSALTGLGGASSAVGAPLGVVLNQQTATIGGRAMPVGGAGQPTAPAGSAFTTSALAVTAGSQGLQLASASVGPNSARPAGGSGGGGSGDGGSGDGTGSGGPGGPGSGSSGAGQGAAGDGIPDNTPIDLPIRGEISVDPGQAARGLTPLSGSLPQIWGRLVVGAALTVRPGAWTPGSRLSFRWFAAGKPIRLATSRSFRLTTAQLHKRISVQVTGKLAGHADTAYKSTTVATVAPGRFTQAKPLLTGRVAVGRVLTAHHSRTVPSGKGVAVAYRWYLDGRRIAGATRSTLRLKAGWRGKRVTVKSIATAPGYVRLVLTSRPTPRIR